MRANEFVKEFGIEKAKLLLSTHGKTIAELKGEYTTKQLKEYQGYIVSGDLMSLVELKHLVESHEYIENFSGLVKANRLRGLACFLTVVDCKEHNKHIDNVESCK